MTYGVYSKDLKRKRLSEVSLDSARQFLSSGCVVCAEKEVTVGYSLTIGFHKTPAWHWYRWDPRKQLGFVSFEWSRKAYKWADKVVEEYVEIREDERDEVARNTAAGEEKGA